MTPVTSAPRRTTAPHEAGLKAGADDSGAACETSISRAGKGETRNDLVEGCAGLGEVGMSVALG